MLETDLAAGLQPGREECDERSGSPAYAQFQVCYGGPAASAVVAGIPLTRANEAEIRQRIPQAFGPVLADRLQETVPGAVRPDDRGQQAVIGEPGQPPRPRPAASRRAAPRPHPW
jgi:hypothetical protein